ncbi:MULTISPECIES: sulfurtransferase [unclassified Phenylobacterium]|uniref:sulfurtransferase n=1 Tax=unclassified Phenylobacterium TaxID=2640670 RepID=UPI00083AC08F|nr:MULTISPECIES: rhodanese-like domain-containing protein [unclassified Phenylobacterium]
MRLFLAAMLALALVQPGFAATARERLVVEPAWLAGRLGDPALVVLQVGDRAGYEAGHIPGARLVSLADFAAPPRGPDPLILELPEAEALRARLVALGVTERSRIVVVPTREGVQSATRVVFTLDAAGLGRRTVLLNGGAAAWAASGGALSTEVPAPRPGRLRPIRFKPLVVDADFVKAHARRRGYAVVDARTPEFFSGAKTGGTAARPHKAGHIAGARSVPFAEVTTPDLKLASPEAIAARFEAAGVKPGDTVIAYCHVGQQATATLFAARTLGLDVLLYDGSFEDWSRRDGPVGK